MSRGADRTGRPAILVPGQLVSAEPGFLRGHGTYTAESEEGTSQLVASVAGVVESINKLITVRPVKSRYIGEVGDLVVGRITDVANKRWKVDLRAHKDAVLALSSVNLPGGVQRIRTYEDQLQMRTFYAENDLISAEVQQIMNDGSIALHTRSLKYGKLENGQLLVVPQVLVRRLRQHNVSLPVGVDVILGTNGYIWITRSIPQEWKEQGRESEGDGMVTSESEALMRQRRLHAETPIQRSDRELICRVRNSICALRHVLAFISAESIMHVYRESERLGLEPKDMLQDDSIWRLTEALGRT
ncbi:unnamed protein product [Phaeothamnion confervicola]